MKPTIFCIYNASDLWNEAHTLSEQPISVSLTHDEAFNFEDTSSFKVLWQVEPPEILNIVDKIIENHKFYDLILTWNEKILNSCPNSRLFVISMCAWLPWNIEGHNPSHFRTPDVPYPECDPSKKQYKASFTTSSKTQSPGHRFRLQVYDALPSSVGSLEIDKHKSPPWVEDKRDTLWDYQFTIAVMNSCHRNYIDEKVCDALISKTIPLVWGCPNLSDFFNMDGIIMFDTIPELMEKLSSLTPDYYAKHFDAVMDNYNRALVYTPIWTRMDKEISDGIMRRGTSLPPRASTIQTPRRTLRWTRRK